MKITDQQYNSIPFQYSRDVREGKIIVGNHIKQAVKRFDDWIENCPEHDFIDHEKAMRVINFFPTFLNHTKGAMAGKPFHLAPFQQFSVYNIFGWQTPLRDSKNNIIYNEDGTIHYVRRIRKIYDKRARGNGKTAEMGGYALNMLSFEQESEAEVYFAATKELQAKIGWKFAKNYLEHPFANPLLKQLGFQCKQSEIIFKPFESVMRPLGGDSKTQDGLSAFFAIIDEYHAHTSDHLLEVLESSMLKRIEPLVYIITTAGFNLAGVCFHFEKVCKEILEGKKQDDSIWIMIHELDADDDWREIKNWEKANPLWNHGLNVKEIIAAYNETQNQPSKIPNFKTKHLNMWVDALSVFVPQEVWDLGDIPIKEENFKTYGCCGALDLSAYKDFTAFGIISNPDPDGMRDLKVYLFCPRETLRQRGIEDNVPYLQWVQEGYIIATEGNAVDYAVLEELVVSEYKNHSMKWVEYDRKFSGPLVQGLMARGIELSPFSQSLMDYSTPTKEFARLLYENKIRHGGNPVLRWMLAGCLIKMDDLENIRISKKHSTRRIDGIAVSIMALGGTMTPDEVEEESQYNDPNVKITFGI